MNSDLFVTEEIVVFLPFFPKKEIQTMKALTESQRELLQFLQSSDKDIWTPKQISDESGLLYYRVQSRLKGLLKKGYVKKRQINAHRAEYSLL